MKEKNDILHIPIELIFKVVQNNMIRQFQLFIYLKCNSCGHIQNSRNLKSDLASAIGVTRNTITTYLKELRQIHWIGYNAKTNIYLIRSFKTILAIENIKFKRRFIFNYRNINQFEAFIGASIYIHFAKYNIRRELRYNSGKFRRAASRKRVANQPSQFPSSSSTVSIRIVAECLGITSYQAHRLKTKAARAGLIIVKTNYKIYKENPLALKYADLGKLEDKVYSKHGKIFQRLPDKISMPQPI